VRRAGTTREQEVDRHDRLIAALARRPAIAKLQRSLDAVADLWSPPDHLHSCMGGRVHWRVQPPHEAVTIVAAHFDDPRADVRRAVLVALRYASPHGEQARAAIDAGLADPHACSRIAAARAAASLELGRALTEPLSRRLDDPTWTVRWYAAAALATTDLRPAAIDALLKSEPRASAHELLVDDWIACARPFEDSPAVAERIAARSVGAIDQPLG
jgi:HEAT repeat protein